MKIPKQFTVGNSTYTVIEPYRMERDLVQGRVKYGPRTVEVTQRHFKTGKPLTTARRAHVFWHEAVHAILKDMGSRKEGDEIFVDGIAKRIIDIIRTAKF